MWAITKIGLRQRIINPSHERIRAAGNALNDFAEEIFSQSVTLQTEPQKAMRCDVTAKPKEVFFPVTQHWPQGWKEDTRKLWRLLLYFSKSTSCTPHLSLTTQATTGPLVTYHSWKRLCPFPPHILLSEFHFLQRQTWSLLSNWMWMDIRNARKQNPMLSLWKLTTTCLCNLFILDPKGSDSCCMLSLGTKRGADEQN